MPAGQTTLIRK